jgi:hypothetical protein
VNVEQLPTVSHRIINGYAIYFRFFFWNAETQVKTVNIHVYVAYKSAAFKQVSKLPDGSRLKLDVGCAELLDLGQWLA